jgi:hypothetical protein
MSALNAAVAESAFWPQGLTHRPHSGPLGDSAERLAASLGLA